jgi:transposase
MTLYCGIDLHSNNHVIEVIDDDDKRLLECKLPNDISATLDVLSPLQPHLAGIAVESTFNWYWLVDGLQDHGYTVHLVNTAAVKQYDGLKHTDDRYDAFHLAHLLRLGILPTGYICPRTKRSLRDALRRRGQLVRMHSTLLISIQSQLWRSLGERYTSNAISSPLFSLPDLDQDTTLALQTHLTVLHAISQQIRVLEKHIKKRLTKTKDFALLQSATGIGPILAMTILLETGEIQRFAKVGNYSSYCRCVKSERLSNNKRKGKGNSKCGNKYLSWAFSEAAHFLVRYSPQAKRFYERKYRHKNGIVAIRAVAHKLARAVYYMLKRQEPFDIDRIFAH